MKPKIGLLVMHYGTPPTMDAVLPYYTHIRHGRPPSEEALQDLIGRYAAIGGPSPLAQVSAQQAELIGQGLIRRGVDARLYVGAKHTHPFIEEVVHQMVSDGIEEAVAIVLAPQYSTFSVVAYRAAIDRALADRPSAMKVHVIERWGSLPELIQALADRLMDAFASPKPLAPDDTLVIFSAHSLPVKIMGAGDPYVEELHETARLVADRAGVRRWTFGLQSASSTGEPWLGPDILDVIRDAHREDPNLRNVVVCTVGFVSDHLEVLYDLGIEARQLCEQLGLGFRRAATIGEDPGVMDALAHLAAQQFRLGLMAR